MIYINIIFASLVFQHSNYYLSNLKAPINVSRETFIGALSRTKLFINVSELYYF